MRDHLDDGGVARIGLAGADDGAVAELDLLRAEGCLEAADRLVGGAVVLDERRLDLARAWRRRNRCPA